MNKRFLARWPRILGIGAVIGAAVILGVYLTAGMAQAAARVGRNLLTGRTQNIVKDVFQATVDQKGLVVVMVTTDSPADKAGIKRGDIILSIDGSEVNNNADVQQALSSKKSRDNVTIGIMRGDSAKTLTATLSDNNGKAFLGLVAFGNDFVGRTGMMGKGGGMPFMGGRQPMRGMPGSQMPISVTHVLVTDVVTDSPASGAGIKVGDLILSADGNPFSVTQTLSDIINGHKVGDSIVLSVQHQGETNPVDITVKLGDNPNKSGSAFLGVQYRMGGNAMRSTMPFGGPNGRQGKTPDIQPGTPITPSNRGGRGGGFAPQRIPGAIVVNVTDGSPAALAGIQRFDVITAINGDPIDNAQALVDGVSKLKPDTSATLTVQHRNDASTTEIKVTLGANPDKSGTAYLGLSLADATTMPKMNVNPNSNGAGSNGNRGNSSQPGFGTPFKNPGLQQQTTGSTL